MLTPNGRKKAVITGATSGIGAAYAHDLAASGHDLIITGRRKNIINNVSKEIEKKFGAKVDVVFAELSDAKDVDLLIEQIRKAGPIDVLVNNAGFTTKGFYHQEDIVEQEKMVCVHVIAMMKLTHTVLPGMIEKRSGAIINVASIHAVSPMSLSATYSSVKAFIKNFSISLHCEVKAYGVKIQCVLPGFTRTDIGRGIGVDMNAIENKPMRKWMQPDEVVHVSIRELKKKNKVVCIPGAVNKIAYMAAKIMPERLWYVIEPRIVTNMP